MKSKLSVWMIGAFATITLLGSASAQNQPQSLGDYARAVKKTKPAQANSSPKVFDNDNLPTASSVSVVGEPAAEAGKDSNKVQDNDGTKDQAKDSGQNGEQEKSAGKKPEIKPGQSDEERQKAISEWKAKLDAQKSKVDLASRELDIMQREYRVKMAEFYANTARRVQNPSGFAADDAKYKQDIADRQKALDGARQKLSDMQDEARRAGAPNSTIE